MDGLEWEHFGGVWEGDRRLWVDGREVVVHLGKKAVIQVLILLAYCIQIACRHI